MLQVSLLVLQNWGRTWVIMSGLDQYRTVNAILPWWLASTAYSGWGILFSWLLFGLWRRQALVRQRLWIALVLYSLFSLVWFGAFAQGDYAQNRFPFQVLLVGSWLALNTWLLRRPKLIAYFRILKDGDFLHDRSN